MRVAISAAVLICMVSSGLWAQVSQVGGDDFGGLANGGVDPDSPTTVSVDISKEIRQLQAPHRPPNPVGAAVSPQTDTIPEAAVEASPQEMQIIELLAETSSFDFVDTPLGEVANWFRKELALKNLAFDRLRLEDEAIDTDGDTVTFSAQEMSFGAALHHILRPFNLTTVVEDETLLITSIEYAEEALRTRVYPVWDLVQPIPGDPADEADYDTLINLITAIVGPNSWDDVGGPANISAYQGMLTITNRVELQTEIVGLLNALRTFSLVALRSNQAVTVVEVDRPAKQHLVNRFLDRRVHLKFEDTPLREAIRSLQPAAPLTLLIDAQALEDEAIDASSDGVTLDVKDITVGSGLQLMLRDLQLTYVIQHEALMITSREAAEETLLAKVYGCAGLIDMASPTDIGRRGRQLEELMNVVASSVAASTWDEVGGPASMVSFPQRGLLVISQTAAVHKQIGSLLRSLHEGRQGHPGSAPPPARSRSEQMTRSYPLRSEFHADAAQLQLIRLLESLLRGTDNEVNNSAANEFTITAIPRRLVISHRRDVQEVLQRLLRKLGALPMPPDGGLGSGDFGGAF